MAFHIHSVTDNLREFQSTYLGLKNNFPSALPNPFMSVAAKAKALSNRGVTLPARLIASAPIVTLSPETSDHFHRFAGKLAKALYYKTIGRAVPTEFRIITHWTTADQAGASDLIKSIVNIMPTLEVGKRINTNLGDQFSYRFNASSEHELIAFTASFSNRIFLTAIGARQEFGIDFDRFITLSSWREVA